MYWNILLVGEAISLNQISHFRRELLFQPLHCSISAKSNTGSWLPTGFAKENKTLESKLPVHRGGFEQHAIVSVSSARYIICLDFIAKSSQNCIRQIKIYSLAEITNGSVVTVFKFSLSILSWSLSWSIYLLYLTLPIKEILIFILLRCL